MDGRDIRPPKAAGSGPSEASSRADRDAVQLRMAQPLDMDGAPSKYYTVLCPKTSEKLVIPKGFRVCGMLGRGAQGTVFTIEDPAKRDPAVNKYYAFKKLKLDALTNDLKAKRAYREFMLLKDVEHRHIVKLLHAYTPQMTLDDFQDVYLVTECHKRNLTGWVKEQKGQLANLHQVSTVLHQLLLAVDHLHRSRIQHRDLKPDNIVMTIHDKLRLLDFGHACGIQPGSRPYTAYMVTRYYRAPEVFLEAEYSEKVDVWSIGCILAELVNKDILFPGANSGDQIDKITNVLGRPGDEFIRSVKQCYRDPLSRVPIVVTNWNTVLPDDNFDLSTSKKSATAENARDLLEKMLRMDPNQRPSVADCLAHPFVSFYTKVADQTTSEFKYDFALDEATKTPKEWKEMLFRALKDYEGKSTFLEEPSE